MFESVNNKSKIAIILFLNSIAFNKFFNSKSLAIMLTGEIHEHCHSERVERVEESKAIPKPPKARLRRALGVWCDSLDPSTPFGRYL
jgi:hypothetical protein